MKQLRTCLPLFFCIAMLSCNSKKEHANKYDILFGRIDTSTSPRNDFFQYANGGWIKRNPIPDEQSSWGIANLVIEENLLRLRTICEKSSASHAPKGSPDQLLGDFWRTAMDSLKTEQDGLSALKPMLDRIAAMKNTREMAPIIADLRKMGSEVLFSEWVYADAKNSESMAIHFWQGGIGLPEREYYLKKDSANDNIRKAYVAHISRMLMLAGDDSTGASSAARSILALETGLATSSRRLEDLRDPYTNYHKIALASLPRVNLFFDWPAYLSTTGIQGTDSAIIGQLGFFVSLDPLISKTPLEVWKSYMKYHLIQDLSYALPERFQSEAFDFNRLFTGAKAPKPRWKRVIQSAENAMGELLGRSYVKEYFDEKAKQRYSNLVEDIRSALKERISNLSWMSDSTRSRALVKLAAMNKKVGYPDQWKDFSTLKMDTLSWVRNIMEANRWWYAFNLKKLGKPVDRTEWDMFPQTYNAYYNPSNNEIVLPAGIFTVPGLRDEELDDATVYGYAGASTIGHEIIHGFDDEGRKFDEKGNLSNWWTPKDETAFQLQSKKIIRQYDEIEVLPELYINGEATTGENIADLGGVLLGLHAYQKTKEYQAQKAIGGFTPLQRYFMGYAMGWLDHAREEKLRNLVQTDFHAPPKFRVNAPYANISEFHQAFGIQKGDPMYRTDSLRVSIW